MDASTSARAFTYAPLPVRVVFGRGTLARAGEELERLGVSRALLLCGSHQAADAERLAARLGPLAAGVHSGAVMHTPVEATEAAMAVLARSGADGLLSFGGGSSVGLGKALALRSGLPHLCVPTTYAGSEMTPILGETRGGAKTTLRSPDVLPRAVLYDVELTLGLPARLTAASGLNAVAHAAEALYARDGNPVVALMAEEGIRALARALPRVAERPADPGARSDALYGAWLCGSCLGAVGMALHHKLCHVLGGAFNLPHAETHAAVLPHALAYNAPAAPEAVGRVARALGAADAPAALHALLGRLGLPAGLGALGMPREGIDRAAELALADPYWNPRPVEAGPLRAALERAWRGDPPAAA